jgi:uncharacterized protein YjbI with pentapeptide repeats
MNEDHLLRLQSGMAAWNAWRATDPAPRPALAHAPLRAMDLSGANLSGADLSGADLRGTQLSGADLRGADLRGANLFKAELTGAQLADCDLRGVRFLNPNQLRSAAGWHDAWRDEDLALDTPLPTAP